MSVTVSFPYGSGTFTVVAEGGQAETVLHQCLSVGDLVRFFEIFSDLSKSQREFARNQRDLEGEADNIELAEVVRLHQKFINELLTILGGISSEEALRLVSLPLERRTSEREK